METTMYRIENYLEASEVFHWAYMSHYVRWMTGRSGRHQRTEKVLKRLVKNGKLKAMMYGKRLVYTRRRTPLQLYHGLQTTECLVRLHNVKRDGVAIPERYFRKLGAVPEFGILYPDGTLLLVEFSTKSNFFFTGMMSGKLNAYRKNLKGIEEKFNGKAKVIFILDVPRETVERYVGSLKRDVGSVASLPSALYEGVAPLDPFIFTDYKTFLDSDPLSAIWFDMEGEICSI